MLIPGFSQHEIRRLAGPVWGYALVWFLVTDPIKLLAYKVLDTINADRRQVASKPLS